MASIYVGSSLVDQRLDELETTLTEVNAVVLANTGDTAGLQEWASDRVKYIYPNGGSESYQTILSPNSIYHENSPFPAGVNFRAVTEFNEGGSEWYEHDSFFSGGTSVGHGCRAFARAESGQCVITTGRDSLGGVTNLGGCWHGSVLTFVSNWRVRCIREG